MKSWTVWVPFGDNQLDVSVTADDIYLRSDGILEFRNYDESTRDYMYVAIFNSWLRAAECRDDDKVGGI